MYLITLTVFLHIVLGTLVRMIQGLTPFYINLVKFKTYPNPWILPSFDIIRTAFVLLILYNSFVLTLYFNVEMFIVYFIWYLMLIYWITPFANCRFYSSFQIMALLTLYIIVVCVETPLFIPNTLWCVYMLYITSWYTWCLPI